MHTPSWDSLDQFVDPADFGVVARFEIPGHAPRDVPGIFDDTPVEAGLGDYTQDAERPRFTATFAGLAGIQRQHVATIGGATYRVMTSPKPDGTGMAYVDLTPQE